MNISKKNITNHFRYSWWIYVLIIIISIFTWDLIYTSTAYRPPENKKIDWFIGASPLADSELIDQFMLETRINEFQDMEEMSAVVLFDAGAANEMYGQMQLTTYIMAGEGDVYLLSKDKYRNFATNGAFVNLDQYIESNMLDIKDIDRSRGYIKVEETEDNPAYEGLFAIPAKKLTGLEKFNINIDDTYFCVTMNSGNKENAIKFLNYIISTMYQK